MSSVYIKTYGCQMNERDSEQVARDLVAHGYTIASHEKEADVILLNTCSVREMAESKAIGKMGFLKKDRRAKPQLVLGYLGCMAQRLGGTLAEKTPHVDLIVGTQKFHRVADYVTEAIKRREELLRAQEEDEFKALALSARPPLVDVGIEEGSQNTIRDHLLVEKKSTEFISIMQGCNMHCTFCIVPTTRGPERSRPINEIVQEAKQLVEHGVKEVTLLGQIVNLYGRHEMPKVDGKSPFVQLLEALHAVHGLERIRFTSPHPMGFRKDLVECIGRLPKVMEHVHLPLQSGSDRILKAMHRPYTVAAYRKLVHDLRSARPEIAITTDIIVGFPGETEEDYLASRRLAEELQFDGAFIFRYSPRGNTPAATMENQLPEEIKEIRNKDLLDVVNTSASKKLEACVGTLQEVLCEGPSRNDPTRLAGRTRTNKIVIFEGGQRFHREIFEVRITRATSSTLYGDPAITIS
ncbi:MAG: tRNA (N6-isopentenyl adenosine(37)-C2)-methylthiotransferase MiaB [Verrucomicrobia bacterium]|nr:tRNA (N6-isopentenyl adenosine(37)-C2)-methylthiotransferase MiaB [Verrucomicrobiota bacterium]